MNKPLILCVDDEQNILDLLTFNLQGNGFDTLTAGDGAAALALAREQSPALILLDLMLPDISGIEVLSSLKAAPATAAIPIVMLTAKDDEESMIHALDIGADDYVMKPFSVREVVARVKAQLRRTVATDTAQIRVRDLLIDSENYEVFRNGEKMILTLKEFELLRILAENQGKVLTRDFLLDRIWGYEYYGETRTIDVHIRHLRTKLGEDADLIETVRGVGYRLKAE